MRRIAALVVTVMVALGIGVLIQPSSALASVSGGGCTASANRDGPYNWTASACISYNTLMYRVEWDGYIDHRGTNCSDLYLKLYRNGSEISLYHVGCPSTGHIPLQYYYTKVTGDYQSRLEIKYAGIPSTYVWKSPTSYLR
ncbi:hypothetical protein [Micromonospora sp. NPDC005806]|uniref:hypothetical protein n=1 Tax=Micromonospora sp. NPDC005806 TaxID=3364234 RepID=UPI00369CEBAD